MTKRKASVALDSGNEGNGTQDNTSNNASTANVIHASSGQQNGSSIAGDRQQQIDDSNNQNDNSNSSSTNNNNNGGQHKSKKERADNWSSAEITVLHRGIDSRRDIFYGPPSQATKKQRELAWNDITKEVNSVSTTPRSLSQVMKKFKNEKCRAKRKFIDSDKDGHSNVSSNNNSSSATVTNNTNDTTNLSAQNHAHNNQQQLQSQPQQSNHMTSDNNISAPQSSINVVKLAPQNVAKTMIDLPAGHVQQIQMPNEDMVLIVQPEMDGIISGMNIVSDALQNHQHNHLGQHTIQTLNTSQSLANGTIGNGMMARTIPATSMCSLVYSTGGEVCTQEQQVASNVSAQGTITTNHLGVNAQNLMHHRGSLEQNQSQHQQQQQQQHHHQMHHQQQQQSQSHQQPSQHQQHQSQQQQHHHHHHQQHQPQATLHQQHFTQNHLTPTGAINNTGGVAVESQLKNLLINLLFKDGQHSSMPMMNQAQDFNKQRNDPLTTIATSLNKIEGHLSKISKMASTLLAQNMNINLVDNSNIATQLSGTNIGGMNNSDVGNTTTTTTNNNNNNNSVSITNTGNKNQRGTEA